MTRPGRRRRGVLPHRLCHAHQHHHLTLRRQRPFTRRWQGRWSLCRVLLEQARILDGELPSDPQQFSNMVAKQRQTRHTQVSSVIRLVVGWVCRGFHPCGRGKRHERKNNTGTLKEVFVARKLKKTEGRKTSTVNAKVDVNLGSRPYGLRIQPKPSRKPDDGKPSTKKNNG